jgi:hypothetical protein
MWTMLAGMWLAVAAALCLLLFTLGERPSWPWALAVATWSTAAVLGANEALRVLAGRVR